MLGRGPLTPLNGPIPFQLPLSASDAPVGGSQPKTGKKRILSSRQQYISKWKTKACDVVKLLVDRGKMVDPGDIAGLESTRPCSMRCGWGRDSPRAFSVGR